MRKRTVAWVLCLLLGWAGAVIAGHDGMGQIDSSHGPLRKLGRGIANVATCPLELIRTPSIAVANDGWLHGLPLGVLEGVWRTALRGVVGAYEIATFPVEVPEDYEPLLKPEFVFSEGTWIRNR